MVQVVSSPDLDRLREEMYSLKRYVAHLPRGKTREEFLLRAKYRQLIDEMHEEYATMYETERKALILQKLKEEMDAKREFVAALRPFTTREELFYEAKHRQILGDKEEKYEIMLEIQRRKTLVREHEAIHPPNSEECPICLETIKLTGQISMIRFACCGNAYCSKCQSIVRHPENCGKIKCWRSCPLCRAPFLYASETEKKKARLLDRARDGRSWAQWEIGRRYL